MNDHTALHDLSRMRGGLATHDVRVGEAPGALHELPVADARREAAVDRRRGCWRRRARRRLGDAGGGQGRDEEERRAVRTHDPIYRSKTRTGPEDTRARLGTTGAAQTLRTFCACKPFGPWATSNSTVSPSARLPQPSAWLAVTWTNTSGPDSCAIKPKPFASLNHFTLPFAIPFRPQHMGARPRTGSTQATAAWDGLKQKPRDVWSSRKRRQPVTVPRMLEPRAKVWNT